VIPSSSQSVKTPPVEITQHVHYNHAVSTARILRHFYLPWLSIVLAAPLLMGGACEKKTSKPTDTGAINALDRTGSGSGGSGSAAVTKIDTTPLPDIDISKLDSDKQQTFYRYLATFGSPCGKGESLRASYTNDTSCKRAPYAVRYTLAMLEDEIPEEEIVKFYDGKYVHPRTVHLDISKAPRVGPEDAPVKLVEFYDYGCPHCKEFRAVLDMVAQRYDGKVTEYFMMFPLGHWPDSKSAAQAAIAASKQGKFKEMHALLFAKAPAHSKDNVLEYAASLGLDMAKFEADYNAAEPQVGLDKVQGDTAGVDSTPTVFFNDRKYEGPMIPKYIGMWIDEEVAVNR